MSQFIVRSDAEFARALSACAADRGGQIILAAGTMLSSVKLYDAPGGQRHHFSADGLLIAAEDPNTCGVGFVAVENARNVEFAFVRTISGAARNAFNLSRSQNIRMRSCIAANTASSATGVSVRGCDTVRVFGSRVERVATGVFIADSENVLVEQCVVRKTTKDCVNIGNNVNRIGIVRNQVFGQEENRDPDHHYDLIQLWVQADARTNSSNIRIDGNLLMANRPDPTPQGIFGRADYGDNDLMFRQLDITNNTIYTRHAHAIAIKDVDGIRVKGNTLIYAGRDNPPTVNIPGISITGKVSGAEVEGNVFPRKWGYPTDWLTDNVVYDLEVAV